VEIDEREITDPALMRVAEAVAAGRRLGRELAMVAMTSPDVVGLGAIADWLRRQMHGRKVYYVLNRHVNYSNVCSNRCAFCAFWREPDAPDAYTRSPRELGEELASGPRVDEVHVVGSCNPGLELEYYEELLRELGKAQPWAVLKAFTAVEVDYMARVSGLSPAQVLERLKAAGLKAMPGGGAEVFSPRVRAKLCPSKTSGERWLEIMATAHQMGIRTNATMLFGHIETPAERVDHLMKLRELQDRTGGFMAFIPLVFHPANTRLAHIPKAGGAQQLRVIAASRLILDNFPHIKAYWVMLGPKPTQLALNFGANDVDGTVVAENITHEAGATSPRGMSESQLVHLVRSAGLEPVRRGGLYEVVHEH